LWTVLGTIVPGIGLVRAGHRVAGGVILAAVALGVAGLAGFGLLNPGAFAQLVLDPDVLNGAAVALLVLALAWIVLISATQLSLRPSPASPIHRVVGAALVGVLSFAVAAPMALLANYAYTSATAITAIFGPDTEGSASPATAGVDPWANTDRLNILILGGDSGLRSNRSAAVGARTDTVMVASIDTHTGLTTLITLPRNAEQVPFPPGSPLHRYYPNGFYKPGAKGKERAEYLLNAMYRNVPAAVPADLLGKTKDLGAAAMMQAVGYSLGLDIHYYVFVNLDGFKDFVNAIGGLTLNVNYAIPIGGHNASPPEPEVKPDGWIEPGGAQHLSGRLALWYARGRYHLNDYSRMERQRCVVYAVTQQTGPTAVLTNYQAIAATGAKNISTNVPQTLLPALAELGLKVKDTRTRSLVFDPSNGFLSYQPDWNAVRARVKKALAETARTGTASPSTSTTPGATGSRSDDLASVCSYHPDDYQPTKR
jgi:LCP family protein required for cell wall assembly